MARIVRRHMKGVLALFAVVIAASGHAENTHGPSPESPGRRREISAARTPLIRSFRVSPNVTDGFPASAELPLSLPEGSTPLIEFVGKSSPFWEPKLAWLEREVAALVNDFPEIASDLPFSFEVYGMADDTAHETSVVILTPGDFETPSRLRRKLMRRVLYPLKAKRLGPVLVALQSDTKRHPVVRSDLHRFSQLDYGPFLSHGLLDAWARSRATNPDLSVPPGITFEPKNFTRLEHGLARAEALTTRDPRTGRRAYATLLADHFIAQMRDRADAFEREPSPEALSRTVSSFLSDFSQQSQAPALIRQWDRFVFDALSDPKHYRTFVSPTDPMRSFSNPAVISFASLLDDFSTRLPPEQASLFAELRKRYRLTSAEVDAFEQKRYREEQRAHNPSFAPLPDSRWRSLFVESPRDSLVGLAASWPAPHSSNTKDRATDPTELLSDIIQEHRFRVDRDLLNYLEAFPASFGAELLRLGPSGHWIDMGCGEGSALRASRRLTFPKHFELAPRFSPGGADEAERLLGTLSELAKKPVSARPRVTGVTKKISRSPLVEEGGRFEIKAGKFVEEIPKGELEAAEILTDYYGPFAYAPQVDEILTRYGELLKPGGTAYLYFGEKDHPLDQNRVEIIRDARKTSVPLIDWVEQTAKKNGLEVQRHTRPDEGRLTMTLSLRRPEGVTPRFPPLHLVRTVDRDAEGRELRPPIRYYEER